MRPFITTALALSAVVAAIVAPRLVAANAPVVQVGAPSGTAFTLPAAATPDVAISDAPARTDGPDVRVRLDRSSAMANGVVRAELTLIAPDAEDDAPSVPTDVILVLDRSGSMGGQKMLDARRAAHALVGQLGEEDRVGIVSFAGRATVDVPLQRVTRTTRAAIDALHPGGGTGMNQGLQTGLAQLAQPVDGRARRMILLSDGLPNSKDGLLNKAGRAAQLETPLTTVGIGDDYDPQLLQRLADTGTGNHYWANPATPLDAVFAAEFDASRSAVTRNTRVAWTGADDVRVLDWGGLPSSGDGVALGSLFSGQKRTVWVTLQLDDAALVDDLDLGDFQLAWTDMDGLAGTRVADAGTVGVTRDLDVVAQNLDADNWEKNVVENEYNAVLTQVTEAVAKGDKAAAVQQLQAYQARNASLNAHVQSKAVVANLAEVAQLEADLANDRVHKKGLIDLSTKAYQGRRSGSSKGSFGSYGSR